MAAAPVDPVFDGEDMDDASPRKAGALDGRLVVPRSGSWLREIDEMLIAEDEERNAARAEPNRRLRGLLHKRREQRKSAAADAVRQDKVEDKAEEAEFIGVTEAPKPFVGDESLPPWFQIRHVDNVALRLHEELIDFHDFMALDRAEVEARRNWVEMIGTVARSLWPKCGIRIFGSFYTKLSLPNGDVDVAIFNVPCSPATAMKVLADKMLSDEMISWLEIIESAKIPVMKIRSQACGLRADVVIEERGGLSTSIFIKNCMKELPHMKYLLVFLKYFLLQRGLNDTFTGGMGSYLLCNVVLHFLQRHPSTKDPKSFRKMSLGHFLIDFFQYYGKTFDYSSGVSVLNGGSTFRREDVFPDKGKGKGKDKGKGGISLCLQSPLSETPIDLGGPCFRMSTLRNLFHHGYHVLADLFVKRPAPEEGSLISPFLLDPAHGVIASRFSLMSAQPAALSKAIRIEDDEDAVDEDPPAKRARVD